MSYTVYMLDDAERDLRDIHSYIKHHFSAKLANELYIEIKTKILMLEENPLLGTPMPELVELGMLNWRQMVVLKKNKIVYEVDKHRQHIYVYLICTERQDFEAFLQKRLFRG